MATRTRALAHAGRRVEALDAYGAFRRRLVDGTGLEPTAALSELHRSLLDDDAESPQPTAPIPAMPPGTANSGARIQESALPSGTVTLLFSDIEGATALFSRIGPAYVDTLDGQRPILRKTWAG